MSKVKSFQLIFLAMIVLFFLFPVQGFSSTKKTGEISGPDRIVIQLESQLKKNEMPPVGFLHDVHTKAVGDKCTQCHTEEKDGMIFRFKRTKKEASMELYHNECVACHAEKKAAKEEKFGPLTAECRTCHVEKQPVESTWKKIEFDKSLHFVHVSTPSIKGMKAGEKDNCSKCHHQYNEKTKETFFTKGQEEACIYCHKSEGKNDIRSIRQASHAACVKCHQELKTKNVAAGPVLCAGCHDAAEQAKIEKVKDIPRLKRNQPDIVAITGWKAGSNMEESRMNGVAFNHQFHETKTQTCKACHHQSLKKCSDCHSVDGADVNGGFVSIEKAMHDIQNQRSCVGCHKAETRSKDCAGCHFLMPTESISSESCKTCHSLTPEKLKTMKPETAAKNALKNYDTRYSTVPVEKIPEKIVISALSKDYKPSTFPHRKVVRAIIKRVEKSEMAKTFHGDQAGLCVGCHHNAPKTLDPPKCASCHSKNGPAKDGRPGLKGAFHGQCVTCHQKMEVQAVSATDCVKCHEEKK